MKPDDLKLKSLQVSGMRCLASVDLLLSPLTVVIGSNGSGKSSLIEAVEILRKASQSGLIGALYEVHGGATLFRQGTNKLTFGACFKSESGNPLNYQLTLRSWDGVVVEIEYESLTESHPGKNQPLIRFERSAAKAQIFDSKLGKLLDADFDRDETLLSQIGVSGEGNTTDFRTSNIKRQLATIQIHGAIETTAMWIARTIRREQPLRGSNLLKPAERLEYIASNLANALYTLCQSPQRARLLNHLRLGLGENFQDLSFPPDPAGGRIALSVRFAHLTAPVASAHLSDGQLAFLATIAACLLAENACAFVMDEPELHLNPGLLIRAWDAFSELSETTPVILATHSTRLLDLLQDPVKEVVLCELDENGATKLKRPNAAAFTAWSKNYQQGLGSMLNDGLQPDVFDAAIDPSDKAA